MARRLRKQKITLRFRRREQLKHHLRAVIVRSAVIALVIGFSAGLVTGGESSFLSRFLQRHTPQISQNSSQTLSGIPILTELPKNRVWLWMPGSGYWLKRRVIHRYTSVRSVWLERLFESNKIVVHLEPRIPLVIWNGSGFDQDGVLFALTPGTWNALPQVSFLATVGKAEIGRWLWRLSTIKEIWSLVVSIKQESSETLELTLKTGAVIIWGPLELESLSRKAQTLARVLDDAHQNMGGVALADLRFFDQGRIIVRPKGVRP